MEGALKQPCLGVLKFSFSLRSREADMKEYSWNNFKDLVFGNPAVVKEVRFQTSFALF